MKKWNKVVLPAVVLTVVLAAGGSILSANAEQSSGTINKGVYIGEVDVSGMTKEQAEEAVKAEVATMESASIKLQVGTDTVTATAGELGAKWANTDVVEQALELGKAGNLIKRYKENKDLQHEPAKFELEYTADASTARNYVETKCKVFEKEAQEGSLTRENGEFEVVPGVIGQKINVEDSVYAITNYMNSEFKGESGTVTLSVNQDKPKFSDEELSKIEDVLGTYTTYYGSTTGRNQNVERGAELLNGHLLYPGDSFSVTDAVVPFNAENGYEMAPSYESGRVVDSYGGGICQVSTTLYNALLLAELDVTERSNHTMIVTYVEPSMDAAIAEGLMDLVFVNNTDAPIYLAGSAYGGELTFTIYGHETRSADRVVEYVSETLKTFSAEGVALYANPNQNVGYLQQTQSALTGKEARLWKYVTENGETTKTQINSSYYQAAPVGYEVGTATADPNQAAAISNAIAANDLNAVQAAISGGATTPQTQPTTEAQTPSTDPNQTPTTDAPQTEPNQTPSDPQNPTTEPNQTPATDAPQTDANGQPPIEAPTDPNTANAGEQTS